MKKVTETMKFKGVFLWHHHEHEDEMLMVWRDQK
jgi:hypothetical protein